MSDEPLQDDVPADLAASFPQVGAPSTPADVGNGLTRLHEALDDEGAFARVSSLGSSVRWMLAGAWVLLLCGVVLAATPRPDLMLYPRGRLVLELGVLLAALVLALHGALRPLTLPAWSAGRRVVPLVAGGVSLAIWCGLPMAHADHPASLVGVGEDFVPRAVACLLFGLGFAALAGGGLAALSRARGRQWLPGALGVWAAALMGLAALYLHCPITHPQHLWAGHATVVVPALLIFWLVRGRLDG